jgi:hypothetical protein
VNPLNILKIIPLRLPFSTAPEIKCMYPLLWPFPFAYSVTMCYANFTLRLFHASQAKLPTSQSKFCASNENSQIHFGHNNPDAYQTHPIYFFFRIAPQQMLQTHRSLKASCATLRRRRKMMSFFF